jgi:hypothetical protein
MPEMSKLKEIITKGKIKKLVETQVLLASSPSAIAK